MTDETPARTCVRAVRIDDARQAPLRDSRFASPLCSGSTLGSIVFLCNRLESIGAKRLVCASSASSSRYLALEHAREKPVKWSNALERPGSDNRRCALRSGDRRKNRNLTRNGDTSRSSASRRWKATLAIVRLIEETLGSFLGSR
jgi:hypothetical protein